MSEYRWMDEWTGLMDGWMEVCLDEFMTCV